MLAKQIKDSTRLVLSFVPLMILSAPIVAILAGFILSLTTGANPSWDHLKSHLLTEAMINTGALILLTLFFSGLLGTLLAAAVTLFDFPFKGPLKALLYLPIALPPYIAAYVLVGIFSYTGNIQRTLRHFNILLDPSTFDIMTLQGAVFIYVITLYPYVYGAVKGFLENHSGSFIETARTLGYKPIPLFLRVVLPLIRLPLTTSLLLVMMEVVSEYGVVKYFNLNTLSALIFKSWFGMGDAGSAMRLSFYVMVAVVAVQGLEEVARGRRKYNVGSGRSRILAPIRLTGLKGWAVTGLLLSFLMVVFFLPVGQMVAWGLMAYTRVSLPDLSSLLLQTLFYAGLATAIILGISLLVSHASRWMGKGARMTLNKLSQLGYAMPGAIIAVGTIAAFVLLDGLLHPLYRWIDPQSKKLVLSSSMIMLVYAFVVRYMAVGYSNVQGAFSKLGTGFNDAARTLGHTRTGAMLRVELPMMKGTLVAGFILTFIDIVKELPLTLLLRPFNYNSLASKAYEYANDERIHEASVPALIIVFLSAGAVWIIVAMENRKGGSKQDATRN